MLGKGLAMLGSAATVAAQLTKLEAIGVNHVMFLQNFGNLERDSVKDSVRRIAQEVIPQARRPARAGSRA